MAKTRGATAFWWTRRKNGVAEKVAAVDYVDELGQSHRLTFGSMGEARAVAEEKRAQFRRREMGLEVAKARCDKSLFELCEWWLKHCCKPRGKPREQSRLRVQIQHERDGVTLRKIGKLVAADVTSEILEEHFDQLQKEGLGGSSINKLRQTLRTVYNKARKRNIWRGANPVVDTEPRAESAINYFVLELRQLNPTLANIEPEWRDLFAAAMLLGLRKGELFGARKTDVNREDKSIRVNRSHGESETKTSEARWLPLPAALWPFIEHALDGFPGVYLFPDPKGEPHKAAIKVEQKLRAALAKAGIVEGFIHKCRRCASRGTPHHERHPDSERRRCPNCTMLLWPSPVKVKMKFHELRHSTNTLLASLGVPETVRADILGHRTKAMTRRYTHLSVKQMRDGFRKLDSAKPITVAPGVPTAPPRYLRDRLAPLREPRPADAKSIPMQADAARLTAATDAGLTLIQGAKKEPRTEAKNAVDSGLSWSGTPDSNWRPSPWQGDALPTELVPRSGGVTTRAAPLCQACRRPGRSRWPTALRAGRTCRAAGCRPPGSRS
jgi:integrase